jgi:hypothetical protein
LIITGWDAEALALGGGIVAAACVVFMAGASRAVRMRLART